MPHESRRTAFITGASSGFGAAIAIGLAARGWRVIASMRDTSGGDALQRAADSHGAPGSSIEVIELDVTDEASRTAAVAHVLDACDGLDLVLHCAGYTTAAFFEDMPPSTIRNLFETNFFGAVEVTRLLIPSMRARATGTIAVVSSNAVNIAHPMYSIYAATKWALEGWAEALDIELAPFGVSVRILQPGNHDTSFGTNVKVAEPSAPYARLQSDALVRMGRLGERARDARTGAEEMCEALDAGTHRLRTRIGFDDKLMAALGRWAPYGVRRTFIRRLTGIK